VVQDVFLRVLQRRTELARIAEIRPWLVRIAWNLAIDRTRKRRPDQIDEIFAAGLVSRELAADDAVEEAERHVLLLSAMEELSTAEIAAVMRKSESSIRSLLFRARARLRERLKD
jgi:RNA polymerase sigma-70 factor (ECF subfamily)